MLRSAQNAEARVRVQMQAIAAADEDLRVQQQRYALGASTLLDLLASQTALNQARQALIQARFDGRVTRAQLAGFGLVWFGLVVFTLDSVRPRAASALVVADHGAR